MEQGGVANRSGVLDTVGDDAPAIAPVAVPEFDPPALEEPFDPALLGDLHAPDLVLSADYVGADRRGAGWLALLRRATFAQRRSLLSPLR